MIYSVVAVLTDIQNGSSILPLRLMLHVLINRSLPRDVYSALVKISKGSTPGPKH